jgi:FeS assembly protein SufB
MDKTKIAPEDLNTTYQYGWHVKDEAGETAKRGLNQSVVEDISGKKNEPEWMRERRLKALTLFEKKPMPLWGADLTGIDFDNIKYFVRSTEKQAQSWEDLPEDIKYTYDRLGIPEAERKRLVAGVAAQFECLRGDQKVWTGDGRLVEIRNIKKGDKVYSLDEGTGKIIVCEVKGATRSGKKELFRVVVGDKEIVVSFNHPFYRLNPDSKTSGEKGNMAKWIQLSELAVGDHVAVILGDFPAPVFSSLGMGFGKIDDIVPIGEDHVYDIEVDGPHNFVAEGFVVHNSEVVYHQIREDLEEKGVIFLDTDTGLKEHEDIFKEYFGSVIPAGDNKFAALNTAVWSGGSFIYVPPGVHVDIPLQAYFRINTENMGQFERTLIIVDEGAYVHYVEGCSAPLYSSDSLHSAVVEIIVKKGGRCRYTTIQNWSNNVYNLVTKRAVAHEGAVMEWVDANIGSVVTQKYPAVWLMGEHARGEVLSLAMANKGQHQDTGAKMIHAAPNTSSNIISKSVARDGGRTSYRGLVQILEGAYNSKSSVRCDALLVDDVSRSDTYPYVDVREDDVSMGHEATVSKIAEDQLFYLMSRGMSEEESMGMIVNGFVDPITKELPMEYAIELNRLINLNMEGSVG